jgi:hypothetical protein
MRIGYVSLDWSALTDDQGNYTAGGAGWYRCAVPAGAFNENGLFAVHGPSLGRLPSGEFILEGWDGQPHGSLDVIVMQRIMHEALIEPIKKARATGQVIINDCDDWYDGLDPTNIAFRSTHPRTNRHVNRDHYRSILAASSGLTVSTPYLASRLERLNSNIVVVENAIDLSRWEFRDVGDENPVIGWAGATSFRSHDLEELKGILGPFCEKHGVPFHHGGHHQRCVSAPELLGLPETVETSAEPMCAIFDYPTIMDSFNIGIIPLRDTPFNHAKSDIKGLEYGARGIPFVASPSPAYVELAERGAGSVARRPKDWIRELGRLLDPDHRRSAGKAARSAAEARDIQLLWTQWLSAYSDIQSAT